MIKSIRNKEILGHIGFWLVYILLPLLKSVARQAGYHVYSEINDLLFGLFAFYVSYYLFNRKGNRLWHFLVLIVFFIALGFLNFQIHNYIFKGTHDEFFLRFYAIGYVSTYCVLAAFAYLLYSIKHSHTQNLRLQQVAREQEKAELAQLKYQINPHFLFNTLNAIYSSSLNNREKTPDLILKLSDNFRYVFSEAHRDKVPLHKEIRHLKDYIFLQKERLGDKVNVKFIEDIDDYEQTIAPLILMTFVENMFKHSSHLKGEGHQLKVDVSLKENQLELSCKNPYQLKVEQEAKEERQTDGMGIKTTQKRLELSYPMRHELQISQEKGMYKILLKLQL